MSLEQEMNEIHVNIPAEKLNDLNYLQNKLLEVSFSALQEISNHSDKSFKELVSEFIPDEDSITEDFLNNYGLSKEDIMFKNEKKTKPLSPVSNISATSIPSNNVEASPKVVVSAKSKKKSKIKKLKITKEVKTSPVSNVSPPTNEVEVSPVSNVSPPTNEVEVSPVVVVSAKSTKNKKKITSQKSGKTTVKKLKIKRKKITKKEKIAKKAAAKAAAALSPDTE